jgi:multiple sugar transport system substrate-binding protein
MTTRSKLFIVVSPLLALALALTACGSSATPSPVAQTVVVTQEVQQVVTATPVPSGPVTISFWNAYNAQTEEPYVEKTLIPAFEASHPNIKVQAVNIPYDQFHQKLLTAIAGGSAPDVARLDIIWQPEFANLGALVPLDQAMTDFNTYKDAVFTGPLSTTFYQGHYYGLPLDTNTRVLIYNKTVLQKAGIDNPPATIDDFLADCAKIKALGPNHYCYADGGMYGWATGPWVWSFGGDFTSPDLSKSTGFINGPDTVAAYTFLKNALDAGYIHPGIKGGGVDTNAGLANGSIAMDLDGPWFFATFPTQFPNVQIGSALMPSGKGGSISVVGGEDIAVFQESKNQAAAEEFVRYMLSPDAQFGMASVGQMPVLQSSLDPTNLSKMPSYFGIFFQQLKTAKARTPTPLYNRIEQIFSNDGTAILDGKMTVQAGLDDAAGKIDPLLANPNQ